MICACQDGVSRAPGPRPRCRNLQHCTIMGAFDPHHVLEYKIAKGKQLGMAAVPGKSRLRGSCFRNPGRSCVLHGRQLLWLWLWLCVCAYLSPPLSLFIRRWHPLHACVRWPLAAGDSVLNSCKGQLFTSRMRLLSALVRNLLFCFPTYDAHRPRCVLA